MAPSSGYQLVPKAARIIRKALSQSKAYIRHRLSGQPIPELVPAVPRQSIPRLAALRQARSRAGQFQQQYRLFSTSLARLGVVARNTTGKAPRYTQSPAFPQSATRAALARTTHAPFSSPLRPNLTGGALPRGAGGYGLGGGGLGAARHFSHTGGAHAQQVAQNVHAAVRAFWLKGCSPVYDGTDSRGGAKFRTIGQAEKEAQRRIGNAQKAIDIWAEKGTSLDFKIAPTVTAISAASGFASAAAEANLADNEMLDCLAGDFARQLQDLSAVHADLKRLAVLGALPIVSPDPATVRVRFPGCDADTVIRLCEEVGVMRGVVKEDSAWRVDLDGSDYNSNSSRSEAGAKDVEMALLFPLAPTDCGAARYFGNPSDRGFEWESMMDDHVLDTDHSSIVLAEGKDGLASPSLLEEGYESLGSVTEEEGDLHRNQNVFMGGTTGYEGVEGIYRFLAELEMAERR